MTEVSIRRHEGQVPLAKSPPGVRGSERQPRNSVAMSSTSPSPARRIYRREWGATSSSAAADLPRKNFCRSSTQAAVWQTRIDHMMGQICGIAAQSCRGSWATCAVAALLEKKTAKTSWPIDLNFKPGISLQRQDGQETPLDEAKPAKAMHQYCA